jgi:hypothetical protein
MAYKDKDLLRRTVNKLCNSLVYRSNEWKYTNVDDKLVLRHYKTDIQLWVGACGPYVYKPNQVKFGFWDKRRLRRAVKYWIKELGDFKVRYTEEKTCRLIIEEL